MGNFAEAIKTDKALQQQVTDAIKKVAENNGLTLDEKSYANASKSAAATCGTSCGTLCLCTL
jgi:hypothetical protein